MSSIHTIEGLVSLPAGLPALQRRWSQLLDAERQLEAARLEASARMAALGAVESDFWSFLGDRIRDINAYQGDFDAWWREASRDERQDVREYLETIHGQRLSRERIESLVEDAWHCVLADMAIAEERVA